MVTELWIATIRFVISVPPHAVSDNNGILRALYTQYSDSVMSARSVVLTSMGGEVFLACPERLGGAINLLYCGY